MAYITRTLEGKFLKMSRTFKVVMLTGARQVGKSTMLKHLAAGTNRTYVSLDDGQARQLAAEEPRLFFQLYKPPLLIDEVQKAPQLMEEIKLLCDASEERGLFWLTGSQSKKLLQQAGDSLAGRLCLLQLHSLSAKEVAGCPDQLPTDYSLAGWLQRSRILPPADVLEVYNRIWEGGMPQLLGLDAEQRREYWSSYIETYLMRDAVEDNGIHNTEGFRRFLRGCAAFNGQLLNYADLAAAAGVSGVTAKEWLRALQSMGLVFLLEPFYTNQLKRLVKRPKLYFCDSGLCAYLSSWTSRDTLLYGAAAGPYLESYVVGEMLRNACYGRERLTLSFYRDTNQREIDLLVEREGLLHPFEIKKGAASARRAVRAFAHLPQGPEGLGPGGVICLTERPFPLDARNSLIPVHLL